MMLSKKIIKEKLPAFIAFIGDLICGLIVVRIVYASTNHIFFTNPKYNFEFISGEIWIPIALSMIFAFFGSYQSSSSDFGRISLKKPAFILILLFVVVLLLLSYNILYTNNHNNPRYIIRFAACILIFIMFMGLLRLVIELFFIFLLKKGVISHKILLVFQTEPDAAELKKISRYINLNNFSLLGYCGPKSFEESKNSDIIPFRGNFSETPDVVKIFAVDEIFLINYSENKKAGQLMLTKIENLPVFVRIVPGALETISGQITMKSLTENPVISIHPRKLPLPDIIIKRVCDIVISIFGMLFTGLILPIVALLIKKSSPGPVFFSQIRLGKNGKPFVMYKFRTMYIDAEKDGPRLAEDEDERITNIGKFFRKNHLDELPQFWNVFKGDMSLVGPRPERAYYAKILQREVPFYRYIGKMKPGLTSLGMVKYGYAHNIEEMSERLLYDIIYINNASFVTDVQIMIYTMIYIIKKAFTRIS